MIELEKPLTRSLFLSAQVNQESMLALTKQIIDINESDERIKKIALAYDFDYKPNPIKIHIDSYGGAVYQCFGLLSVMDNSKTPVHTIVTGCAMSCGFLIAIHGKHRSAHKNATLMYHQVSSGMFGKAADMEEDIIEVRRLQEKIEDMTLSLTKITPKKIQKIYKTKKDWFMNSEEALRWGVIDEIIP